MADETANLLLPYLLPNQAQKHVTLNEGLSKLDALVQLAVESRRVATSPASPEQGVRYILPSGVGAGPWAGKAANMIAHFQEGAWVFYPPRIGFVAYVRDDSQLVYFTGQEWRVLEAPLPSQLTLQQFGLGASPDAATPFLAKASKALFTTKPVSEGGDGDLRLYLNKETPSDVASLVMQTGFSARAELGLAADDDLVVKLSPDGSTWLDGLKFNRATGVASFPRGVAIAALNSGPLAGFRNRLINGDFGINQRSFAGGALSAGAYGFDRWKAGAGGANCSLSGKVLTLTSGSIVQIMEAPDLAGVQVTASVEDLTTRDLTVTLAASGSGSGTVSGDITQGSGRRGVTLTVPGTATGNISLEIAAKTGGVGAPTFKRVQIEPGPVATPYEFRPLGVELSLCMRYYWRSVIAALNSRLGDGQQVGSGGVQLLHLNRVRMRSAPTLNVVDLASTFFFSGASLGAPTSYAMGASTVDFVVINFSGLAATTVGQTAQWQWANIGAPYFELIAEL